MERAMVRVAYAQTEPEIRAVARNLESVRQLLASGPTFDVLVLPELFATGYLLRDRAEATALAEDESGPTVSFLRRQAAERSAWICAGFAERAGRSVFNAAALAGPSGELHVYRKVHLFDRESELFDAGDRPFEAWTISVRGVSVRVGVLVCFDWFFPEAARSLALDGADLLLHPANLVLPYCQDAMRTRCLENRVFAVTANRTGAEVRGTERLSFTGSSQITSPRAEVLSRAPAVGESMDVVEIDLGFARDKRVTERSDFLAIRRPGLYRLG
jgi:predicted amidohydrolase